MRPKILTGSADEVLQKLNSITRLSEGFQEYLRKHLKTIELSKGEILLQQGQTCRNVYFILEGSARSYFYNQSEKECTGWFVEKGDLMISVYSYYTQQAAAESIEMLEDATLQFLSAAEMQQAYKLFPEANTLGRLIAELYYIKSERRAIVLRNSTPESRYKLMLNEHPNILRQAKLGQIASYLSITPETLSRLRASGNI